MPTAGEKYNEYKRKMADWAKLFEREYGHAPSDDDRLDSDTYNALLEKARHYRKVADADGTSASPGAGRDRSSKARRPEKHSPRNQSTPARRPMAKPIRESHRHTDRESRSHGSTPGGMRESRRHHDRGVSTPAMRASRRHEEEDGGSSFKRKSHGHHGRASRRAADFDEDSPSPLHPSPLTPSPSKGRQSRRERWGVTDDSPTLVRASSSLPLAELSEELSEQLRGKPEFAALEGRAREARSSAASREREAGYLSRLLLG